MAGGRRSGSIDIPALVWRSGRVLIGRCEGGAGEPVGAGDVAGERAAGGPRHRRRGRHRGAPPPLLGSTLTDSSDRIQGRETRAIQIFVTLILLLNSDSSVCARFCVYKVTKLSDVR